MMIFLSERICGFSRWTLSIEEIRSFCRGSFCRGSSYWTRRLGTRTNRLTPWHWSRISAAETTEKHLIYANLYKLSAWLSAILKKNGKKMKLCFVLSFDWIKVERVKLRCAEECAVMMRYEKGQSSMCFSWFVCYFSYFSVEVGVKVQ